MNDLISSHEGGESNQGNGSLNDGQTDAEEILVCPACFEPILLHAHLCSRCGAPVSGTALIDPFASIWGEAYAFRQATRQESRPNRVVLIGIWLIFLPGVLTIGILLFEFLIQALKDLAQFRNPFAPRDLGITTSPFSVFVMILILGIQTAILIRVTRNYRRARVTSDLDREQIP